MNINVKGVNIAVLPVNTSSLSKTKRVGNHLEITLVNGHVITLEDYFPSKPKLLTNEKSDNVNEIEITDNGDVSGIISLSPSETESLLGNAHSSLSTQTDNILLLSDSNDAAVAAVAGKSYAVEAFAVSAAILAGAFILDRDKDSNSNVVDATKPNESTDENDSATDNADSANTASDDKNSPDSASNGAATADTGSNSADATKANESADANDSSTGNADSANTASDDKNSPDSSSNGAATADAGSSSADATKANESADANDSSTDNVDSSNTASDDKNSPDSASNNTAATDAGSTDATKPDESTDANDSTTDNVDSSNTASDDKDSSDSASNGAATADTGSSSADATKPDESADENDSATDNVDSSNTASDDKDSSDSASNGAATADTGSSSADATKPDESADANDSATDNVDSSNTASDDKDSSDSASNGAATADTGSSSADATKPDESADANDSSTGNADSANTASDDKNSPDSASNGAADAGSTNATQQEYLIVQEHEDWRSFNLERYILRATRYIGGDFKQINFSDKDNWTIDFQHLDSNIFGNVSSIQLSNADASTSITLDKVTIAALSQSGFQIRGDETDTVTFRDIGSAEKLNTTQIIEDQVYDQYQFEIEGNTYTVLVDSDIKVVTDTTTLGETTEAKDYYYSYGRQYDKVFNQASVRQVNIQKIEEYSDDNGVTFNYTTSSGKVDDIRFLNDSSEIVDFTQFDFDKFPAELSFIRLSDANTSTSITLDKATIAAISQSGFQIRGDETDTVTFKDIGSAEKLDTTQAIQEQVYDQYQFEMGGGTYTVLIDSDINVITA